MKVCLWITAMLTLGLSGLTQSHAAASDGNETSGGGHGVTLPGGSLVALDLLSNPAEIKGTPIQLFEDARTQEAARYALARLSFLRGAFPEFAEATIQFYRQMNWHLSDQPLPAISDSGLVIPGMVQVAMQNEKGDVMIDERLFSKLDIANRSAIIVHEVLLAKFGLKFPRAVLRKVVAELFKSKLDYALIKRELDSVHSAIVQGQLKVKIEVESQSLGGSSGSDCLHISVGSFTLPWVGCGAWMSDVETFSEKDLEDYFKPSMVGRVVPIVVNAQAANRYTMRVYINGVLRLEEVLISSRQFSHFVKEYALLFR